MKKQRHIKRPGKSTATISLLELLKERSDNRLTKIEAYFDLVGVIRRNCVSDCVTIA